MEEDAKRKAHFRKIGWFWSIVGGLSLLVFVFAISGRFNDIHDEWMKCYELKRIRCR